MTMKSVCVYCGSNFGSDPIYTETARAMGRTLAERGLRLVYGGGQVGLMGAVADACIDAGGDVLGVIPDFLHHKEIAHPRVQDMHIVSSMHERKLMMADHADAFVAMPGGLGTMEELFEVWTWSQLGRHKKPVALLNMKGYWDKLVGFLDHMRDEGFVESRHRDMLLSAETPDAVLDALESYEFPGMIASLERAQT
ncbi:TIGR00730 family Rossman fold protein [Maricaulaceae bacterium EIL42A08]|nr:TIGR00730 family Rossman fold protein [Maricaulaceae bacterium EIL42A08]